MEWLWCFRSDLSITWTVEQPSKIEIRLLRRGKKGAKAISKEMQANIRDGSCYQIGWVFGKVWKGGGGRSKFILQILVLYKGLFTDVFRKNRIIILWEWGGVEAVRIFSENSFDLMAWPIHKKGMKGKKNKRQRKRYDGKVVKLDSF